MKMCLRCRSLLPAEALYCTKCRLPLGTSRCPEGHPNPLRAGQTCQVCNKGPLTPGVHVLPLSGLGSLCAVVFLVLALRWGWHHPFVVASWAWNWGCVATGVLFDVPARSVHATVLQVLSWYALLWLLSYLLPSGLGRAARQALRTLPAVLLKWGRSLLKALRPLVALPARTQRGKAGAASKIQDKDKD